MYRVPQRYPLTQSQVSETQDVFSSLLASIFLLDEQIFQFQIVFAQCIVNVYCLISLHIKMKPPGVSDSTIVITVKTDLCVQSVPKLPRDLCQISTILQPTYDTWLLMQKLLNIHLSSDTLCATYGKNFSIVHKKYFVTSLFVMDRNHIRCDLII